MDRSFSFLLRYCEISVVLLSPAVEQIWPSSMIEIPKSPSRSGVARVGSVSVALSIVTGTAVIKNEGG